MINFTCEWVNQDDKRCGVLVSVKKANEHYLNTHAMDGAKCGWSGCTKRYRVAEHRRNHYGVHWAYATVVCNWKDNRGGVCGSQLCHTNIGVGEIRAHIEEHILGTGA